MDLYKIFFATDIHGSTACFRKFINQIQFYDPPSALIMGGDITGKHVIPIVEGARSRYFVQDGNREIEVPRSDLDQIRQRLANQGRYTFVCDETQYAKYIFDVNMQRSVAEKLQRERLTEWLEFAERKLSGKPDTKVIINTGNDDELFIDEIIGSHDRIIFPEGRPVRLNEYLTLISTGYVNEIPWICDRRLTEPALMQRIAAMANQVSSFEGCIFNFHCPPFNTSLDLAPELNRKLQPQLGLTGIGMKHCGSTAVFHAIENYKPSLSLHGHIHDQHKIQTIGRTVCINPGSVYRTGRLQGAFATFSGPHLKGYALTSEQVSAETSATLSRILRALPAGLPIIGPIVDSYLRQCEQESNSNSLIRSIEEATERQQRIADASFEREHESVDAPSDGARAKSAKEGGYS